MSNYAHIDSDHFLKSVGFLLDDALWSLLMTLSMLSSNIQTGKTSQTFILMCSYEIVCRQHQIEQNLGHCAFIALPFPPCLRTEPVRFLSSLLLLVFALHKTSRIYRVVRFTPWNFPLKLQVCCLPKTSIQNDELSKDLTPIRIKSWIKRIHHRRRKSLKI